MGIYAEPRFLPCGDLALSVEFADEISHEANARTLALEYLIQQKALSGVTETVPTFRSLLVYYDPLIAGWDDLVASLRALCRQARPEVLPPARTVELPCCYGGELGFDLEAVATQVGLSPDEVARLHASADYYVYFVGFTPGLPYMTGMAAPVTATHRSSANSSRGPMSVASSPAASSALPTSRLASTKASRSTGPDGGMPTRSDPRRPRSCTVVCGPAS